MSDTNGPQAETTTEQRKPPTLADIVREKTDDGRRIIDFFLDVMEARVEGAELCHRIDAAKQLVKYGSKDAARFIARYRDVPCGHSTRGRPNPADPCSDPDAAGRESAPGPFTEDFLTVLSAVDEDLMARLVRAQTADGFTVVEFLDDVMQDRNEGFKCHHRIAAAKELIVHIVRDESPEPVPSFPRRREPIPSTLSLSNGSKGPLPFTLSLSKGPLPFTLSLSKGPLPFTLSLSKGPVLSSPKGPQTAHPSFPPRSPPKEPMTTAYDRPEDDAPRKQRRREGAARAAMLGKRPNSERSNKEKQDKPAPVELTIAERRIKERLQQHWHEPDPWAAPIDSTHPGRSPPW